MIAGRLPMLLAQLAVTGAILCTLAFNGWYAWHKATDPAQKVALVALALTIDLCKCGFLPAAAILRRHHYPFAAFLLVLLFPFCLAFSTFAGYAALTTGRVTITVTAQAQADARTRAQTAYDEASADLATAKTSTFWTATAGCTAMRTSKQRSFCARLDKIREVQSEAEARLTTAPAIAVDPEIAVLTSNTGLTSDRLTLLVALWPALLIELVASLGFYAVTRPLRPDAAAASGKAMHGPRWWQRLPWRRQADRAPRSLPEAEQSRSIGGAAETTAAPQIKWVIPKVSQAT